MKAPAFDNMANNGVIVYDTKRNFPAQRLLFQLAKRFSILIFFPGFRKLLYRTLPKARDCIVTPRFSCIIGDNIHAENVYLNDTEILDYARVTLGNGTQFSGGNVIITSTHAIDDFSKVIAKPVTLGRNVWVTNRCIILGGVTIGDNSIIGAGSVVTRDIPPNVFAAGNPCRVIRSIRRDPDNKDGGEGKP